MKKVIVHFLNEYMQALENAKGFCAIKVGQKKNSILYAPQCNALIIELSSLDSFRKPNGLWDLQALKVLTNCVELDFNVTEAELGKRFKLTDSDIVADFRAKTDIFTYLEVSSSYREIKTKAKKVVLEILKLFQKPIRKRDRRFRDLFFLKKGNRHTLAMPKKIGIFVDTSGSMSLDDVLTAAVAVKNMQIAFPESKFYICSFSRDISRSKNVKGLHIFGDGTCPELCYEKIKELGFEYSVMISDLCFEHSHTYRDDVLYISTSGAGIYAANDLPKNVKIIR